MNGRHTRHATPRGPIAPIHRAPQAGPPPASGYHHAPNAALLIDFDNVTMGIRSDLQSELRNLLASDIIKGKVAVQRAYADWRRYPQYIVPLAESSIDMIMAPAYGSSKKNATDIRLAIDALELVFTRPEIGTFILLSGDSDFSSLVIKLKEYGKYVIGVGIRESSSDLLVMNCDEYYSYNSLAGLVSKAEEPTRKWDAWELVTEAITRMKRNGDVMRSDRLKQVMQDIDPTFDEKNLGMSKFSRFTQEASNRGLISAVRLENGQYEVGMPGEQAATEAAAAVDNAMENGAAPTAAERPERDEEDRGRRGRRGRGRGRGRDRGERAETPATFAPGVEESREVSTRAVQNADAGTTGQKLNRDEALSLVRRATEKATASGGTVRASELRRTAREVLGRDSESLSSRMFERILRDAHDAGVVELRRRGHDFEVSLAASGESVADQLNKAAAAHTPPASAPAPAAAAASAVPAPGRGMGPRGATGGRGRRELPPELLSIGVVDIPVAVTPGTPVAEPAEKEAASAPRTERRRAPRASKSAAKTADKPAEKPADKGRGRKAAAKSAAPADAAPAPVAKAQSKRARGKRAAAGA